jgi:hypothetical protein
MIPGDDEVRVDIDETVMTITLDRPKANAIDLPTSRKLGESFSMEHNNVEGLPHERGPAHERSECFGCSECSGSSLRTAPCPGQLGTL